MADPGQVKPSLRHLAMVLVAVSLVPLTLKVGLNLLTLPMRFPLGWPAETGQQALGAVSIALALASVFSVAVAWWLGVGGAGRGWAWIQSSALWLRLAAMLAPVFFLVAAAQQFLRFQQRAEGGPAGMPAEYWSKMAWTYGLDLALALLCLIALVVLRFVPPTRTT
ncbi:MAG TPA: hypothetical protein VIT62_12380 [Lysobacter sp.]